MPGYWKKPQAIVAPVVTSGDLDGRIFSLSPEGTWLLYTRKADTTDSINKLWAIDLTEKDSEPIYLRVKNVITHAAWVPGAALTITYSTVEPRTTAPGWQANNDLQWLSFDEKGMILSTREIIEPNAGGIYGWWGTEFTWSPDGEEIVYARPDSIGWVDVTDGQLIPLIQLTPLQTGSDWAWVPGIGWAEDHSLFYTVTHTARPGYTNDETSQLFALTAFISSKNGPAVDIIPQSGMFAYPSPSPMSADGNFKIAYLQAIFPEQSQTSRYRLVTMNQDGSNQSNIFPPEGSQGLEPQQVFWSPYRLEDNSLWISAIYQGNLWLINPDNDSRQQITGDGSISRIDWK